MHKEYVGLLVWLQTPNPQSRSVTTSIQVKSSFIDILTIHLITSELSNELVGAFHSG